jgi:hypothetical protein
MSDIQDLIHTQTVKAYESGVRHEQERITKEIQSIVDISDSSYVAGLYKALELIRGENNGSDKE